MEEQRDQLNFTGAYLSNRMRKGPHGLSSHGASLNWWNKSKTTQPSPLASLFPRVRGRVIFGALLCVCDVNSFQML